MWLFVLGSLSAREPKCGGRRGAGRLAARWSSNHIRRREPGPRCRRSAACERNSLDAFRHGRDLRRFPKAGINRRRKRVGASDGEDWSAADVDHKNMDQRIEARSVHRKKTRLGVRTARENHARWRKELEGDGRITGHLVERMFVADDGGAQAQSVSPDFCLIETAIGDRQRIAVFRAYWRNPTASLSPGLSSSLSSNLSGAARRPGRFDPDRERSRILYFGRNPYIPGRPAARMWPCPTSSRAANPSAPEV